jgi:hypothetical protein
MVGGDSTLPLVMEMLLLDRRALSSESTDVVEIYAVRHVRRRAPGSNYWHPILLFNLETPLQVSRGVRLEQFDGNESKRLVCAMRTGPSNYGMRDDPMPTQPNPTPTFPTLGAVPDSGAQNGLLFAEWWHRSPKAASHQSPTANVAY